MYKSEVLRITKNYLQKVKNAGFTFQKPGFLDPLHLEISMKKVILI